MYKQNLGDADFRSVAIPYILKAHEVKKVSIPYKHPVSWEAPYVF